VRFGPAKRHSLPILLRQFHTRPACDASTSRFTPPAHQLPTPRELEKQRSMRTESGKTPVIKKSKTVHLSRLRLVAGPELSENPNFD
jgi:hypothetical protein